MGDRGPDHGSTPGEPEAGAVAHVGDAHGVDGLPTVAAAVAAAPADPVMSKRAMKRAEKKRKWDETKGERRRSEKAKRAAKVKARVEAERLKDAVDNEAGGGPKVPFRKQLKEAKMSDSKCQVKVALDMSLGHLMQPRDLSKCIKQVLRCYSINRRLANPVQLFLTGFDGACKEEMSKNQGYQNWDINFRSESHDQAFARDKVVYLTSESENVLTRLDQDKAYVVGALVDHNHHKGVCHRLAVEKGVAHARLPIDQYIDMKTRKVLTTDHCFQILAMVASEGLSWEEAFLKILPSRKGATEKVAGRSSNETPSDPPAHSEHETLARIE